MFFHVYVLYISFQQIIVLWIAIGLQKTIDTITRYPGILIVSIFSCWTVGPVKTSNSRTKSIGISPTHTWVNLAITVVFSISYGILFYPDRKREWPILLALILPTVIYILITTFIFILHGQYLTNYQAILCCPNRFRSCCCKDFHNTEYTILNTSTMEEDIAKQKLINQPINFEESENDCGTRCCTRLSYCYLCLLLVLLPFLGIGVFIFLLQLFFLDFGN